MNASIYYKGQEIDEEVLFRSIEQKRAGVFETFKAYHQKVFRLDEHLDRLYESAATVDFNIQLNRSDLKSLIHKTLKSYFKKTKTQEAVMRLTFFEKNPVILIGQRKTSKELYQKGVCLRTSPVVRSMSNASYPEVKTASYHNGLFAALEPKHNEVYEWLMLDRNGYVSEVTIGNIFMIEKPNRRTKLPRLLTPPSAGILNGVTRQSVIECALQAGFEVVEQILTRHDLYNASEAFLTNTSWEILPISEIDKRKIASRPQGSITTKLHREFLKQVKRECR